MTNAWLEEMSRNLRGLTCITPRGIVKVIDIFGAWLPDKGYLVTVEEQSPRKDMKPMERIRHTMWQSDLGEYGEWPLADHTKEVKSNGDITIWRLTVGMNGKSGWLCEWDIYNGNKQ